jgi:hypothetical protein
MLRKWTRNCHISTTITYNLLNFIKCIFERYCFLIGLCEVIPLKLIPWPFLVILSNAIFPVNLITGPLGAVDHCEQLVQSTWYAPTNIRIYISINIFYCRETGLIAMWLVVSIYLLHSWSRYIASRPAVQRRRRQRERYCGRRRCIAGLGAETFRVAYSPVPTLASSNHDGPLCNVDGSSANGTAVRL